MQRILLFAFIIIFILEGIGFNPIRENILYLYLLLPEIAFFYLIRLNKRIYFPRNITVFFTLFIVFSFISTFLFSVNIRSSVKLTLFYLSGFLIFIFFYNFRELGKRIVNLSIIWGSIVFTFFFLLLQFNITLFPLIVRPYDGYQMVVSNFGSHNHLGDFLGLSILLITYGVLTTNRKKGSFYTILILPFFLLSFSRSAYNALLMTATYYFIILRKWASITGLTKFVIGTMLSFILFFFIITVNESKSVPFFKPINIFLQKTFQLSNYKSILAEREKYFLQAIRLFAKRPLFGIGPGNYRYAANEEIIPGFYPTETAHNIFLEILVENGSIPFVFFILFIGMILKVGHKSKSVYFLLFLYLLFNFQTDYTYRIHSLFVLFMILAGITYTENKNISGSNIFGISALALFLAFVVIFGFYLIQLSANT